MDERYTATISLHIWADSDEEAKKIAEKIVDDQRHRFDNRCTLNGLEETPFGRLTTRPVEV